MGLSAVQADFRAWLVAEDETAAQRLPLSDRRGLSVYTNNYRGQLMACLEESYPKTLAWIGEDSFRSVAAEHIDRVPPHSWTLDEYAEGFPGSLDERYPYDPEVTDLARLELALGETFIAPGARALGVGDLGAVDWERAELKLVPSVTFLDLTTNAQAIWSAIDAEETPPAAEHAREARPLILWRQEFTCCFQKLDADDVAFLPRLAGGLGFEALCGELVERDGAEHGIQLAGQLLARWAHAGLLCYPD